eukprot:15450122-Alexandrium_andersonii.AAC.1
MSDHFLEPPTVPHSFPLFHTIFQPLSAASCQFPIVSHRLPPSIDYIKRITSGLRMDGWKLEDRPTEKNASCPSSTGEE